jgi:hypothetical protein
MGCIAPWGMAAVAMGICGFLAWGPLSTTSLDTRKAQFQFDPKKDLFSRRHFFFGHSELSDILDGLHLLSVSVDVFANAQTMRANPEHPVRKRFLEALSKIPDLTRRRIGMSEIYSLPAMYLLFEEDNPRESRLIASMALDDERINPYVGMLAAFVSLTFLREPVEAGKIYQQLSKHPGAPNWISQLAEKLLTGEDPFEKDARMKRHLCNVLERAFPRAKQYLEKMPAECGKNESSTPEESQP